ncbi:DnaJ subfamily A member 4, partial [Orchesella cincta]
DGEKIILRGEGDQEPGIEPGDIIIVIEEKPHPLFRRRGQDLIVNMELELVEALCGFHKVIETLDQQSPHDKGKLIIHFNVKFPELISPDVCPQLETCLPPRNECIIPDDAEEVTLREFDPKTHARRPGHGGGGNYYDERR